MFVSIHISSFIKRFGALLLVLWATVAAAGEVVHLDLDPTHGDYQIECIWRSMAARTSPVRSAYVMGRIDGDGLTEFVEGRYGKVFGYDGEDGKIKARWQWNIPVGFHLHQRTPLLAAVADYNNDGVDEIFTTIVSEDKQQWRFLAFDPATENVILNKPLPLGFDRREDGLWDGTYNAIGTVKDADGQGRPGIVLLRSVQYDASLRGVLVVDPFSGDTIWEWECGPNPDYQFPSVSDLNGDGNNEIILFGTSPDNLGGRKVNGHSDDEAMVFVLNSRGELLWEALIGPAYVHGALAFADLDGDGHSEIITFTQNVPVGHTHKLVVWDGMTGRQICRFRSEAGFLGVACTEGPRPGTGWIFAGSDDGAINRFIYDGTSLARDRRALHDNPRISVIGAVDFLPEEGVEILIDVEVGEIFGVLNQDLEPLASFAGEVGGTRGNPSLWSMEPGLTSLILANDCNNWVMTYSKTPMDIAGMVTTAGAVVLILVGMAGVFLLGRWQGRRNPHEIEPARRSGLPADREVLYRLWKQLDDVKHEKILEASRGLSRLVWLLDAYAADLEASDDLGARIQLLSGDFTEVFRPRLLGILQLAGSERFETETVERIEGALGSFATRLEAMVSSGMSVSVVRDEREDMKNELGEVEQGLLKLWRSLRDYFSTDPVRMLEGMVLVREGEFGRAGIRTDFSGADTIGDALCLIDGGDLRYVLGNLVDNAVRAMEESSPRLLRVKFQRLNSEISLHFSDTGGGIPPEIQDKIFSGRFSTRHGGGSGLFRSREILHRWGGEITLSESTPDKGTTFILRLRAARKPEAGSAMEAGA